MVMVGCDSYSAIATLEPMSWPDETGPVPPRITTRQVSSSSADGSLLESTSRPRFWALRASGRLQEDPHDRPVVVGLVLEELVVPRLGLGHGRSWAGRRAPVVGR